MLLIHLKTANMLLPGKDFGITSNNNVLIIALLEVTVPWELTLCAPLRNLHVLLFAVTVARMLCPQAKASCGTRRNCRSALAVFPKNFQSFYRFGTVFIRRYGVNQIFLGLQYNTLSYATFRTTSRCYVKQNE